MVESRVNGRAQSIGMEMGNGNGCGPNNDDDENNGNTNHMAWDAEAMSFLFLGKAWASSAEIMRPRKNCLRKPLFTMSPTFGFILFCLVWFGLVLLLIIIIIVTSVYRAYGNPSTSRLPLPFLIPILINRFTLRVTHRANSLIALWQQLSS